MDKIMSQISLQIAYTVNEKRPKRHLIIILKGCIIALAILFAGQFISAQVPDAVLKSNIQTVRFHMYGDQQSLPVYNLNSGDQMELHFDDMDGNTKNYYYSFLLCDYNWQPVNISAFDYIKGFTQNRISNYRYSSLAYKKYTHYQVILPEKNSVPTKSGNYLVKVFIDGDTSKTAFTRRLLVLDQKATLAAKIIQPFGAQQFRTHQKVQFNVNITGINTFSAAQQVKVVILQNNRWDNAVKDIAPTFVRGSNLEYSAENNLVFPGGKEWRWLDLRSFRLLSDRVDSGKYDKDKANLYLKPDMDRSGQRYVYFRDLNGMYTVESYETINPYWQADYANIYFKLAAPGGVAYANNDIYLAGQFTNYEINNKTKMIFNPAIGMYEATAYLKQGYYNYTYIAVDKKNPLSKTELEGNYWETENSYTILVYYKGFADRSDQLIGVGKINSRTDRPGVSF
jgi:hypothetical protein